ncbi:MAG: cytidylate kinase-like family protein [Oscillospiraceae bacterium]|nr:cytidylate kinase-like family protein [Oscillospiraceae bacterium]
MIITISGQYGSGGSDVGVRLAKLLNYRILDSQLVIRAREIYTATCGSSEKPGWWPSRYNIPFYEGDDTPSVGTAYEQAEFKLKTDLIDPNVAYEDLGSDADGVRKAMLDAQSKAIIECAGNGNCIALGKCSNFALRGRPDAVHVFSTADLDVRVKRIMNLYNWLDSPDMPESGSGAAWMPPSYMLHDAGLFVNMSRSTVENLIHTTDKRRAACYEFITGEKWGDLETYDYHLSGNDLNLNEQTEKLLRIIREREAALG